MMLLKMNQPDFLTTPFAERLSQLLRQRQLSQSQLAERMGVSRSTITGWLKYHKLPDASLIAALCRALDCSADWLLGLEPQTEHLNRSGTIHWRDYLPEGLPPTQVEQIAYGMRLFREIMLGTPTTHHPAYDPYTARLALQSALRSGAVQLTSVSRNPSLEQTLLQQFPQLKSVMVADVPERYEDTLIRTEIVAFLAAHEMLSQVIRPKAVGLGLGYTLLRFCELSLPGIDQFSGTSWVPLLAFREEHGSNYTANFLAKLMSVRHPGSRALFLPHPEHGHSTLYDQFQEEVTRMMRNLQAIFVSVSGVDRRSPSGQRHLLAEFRSADFAIEAPDLRSAYTEMPEPDRFGAELLRYLIDEDGNIIGRDSAAGSQIDLDILRYNAAMLGTVCVIAASAYKARAVLTCIRNGLVNAMVIDSEIAEEILKNI